MLDYFGKLNKNVIDQIKYRGTILTGEVTKDNGDGTYDVKISQADDPYPNVETAFYDEVFSIGEIVVVTFEDGNKERPRIWGHAKKIAQEPKIVEVDYSGGAMAGYIVILSYNSEDGLYYLKLYDTNGNYLEKEVDSEGTFTAMWDLCMDSNDNSYFVYSGGPYYAPYSYIKKYDQNLVLLTTYDVYTNEGMNTNGFNFGSDGYLYCLDFDRSSPYNRFITKRNSTDFSIISSINIGTGNWTGEPCLDSSGNIYLHNSDDDVIEKYNSAGTLIATSPSVPTMFARFGCGIAGDYLYFPKSTSTLYYFPLNLSSVSEWALPTNHYGFIVKGGYLYTIGTSGYFCKYDSNRNLIWQKELSGISGREIGSYQFK